MARPVYLIKSLEASDADGIAEAQAVAAAGNLNMNGSLVQNGVAVLDTGRRVGITSAGDDSSITFTVYGRNGTGGEISEVVTGANAGVASTQYDFSAVTRIVASGAAAGNVTVGTTAVGATPWQLVNYHLAPTNVSIAVVVEGTVDYTVQWTYDNFIWVPTGGTPDFPAPPVPFDDPILVNATANGETTISLPVTGWRIQINSGDGSLAIKGIQAGISN